MSPDTKGRYRRQLATEVFPRIGPKHLDEIGGRHVSALLNDLLACDCTDKGKGLRCARSRNGHGLDTRTVDRYYSIIYSVFRYAVREGKLATNPCDRTDWVRHGLAHDDDEDETGGHVYLSHEEYELIRSYLPNDAKPVTDYLVGTGARWGEATAAAVGSIRPDAKPEPLAKIHRAWKKRPKSEYTAKDRDPWYIGATKGRSKRTVEIPALLVEVLRPLIDGRPSGDLLLRAPDGGRLIHSNFVNRRWDPAVVAAMRCPAHPPPSGGMAVDPGQLAGPRCGDNGGARGDRPCRAYVKRGMNRCKDHTGPDKDAMSTCDCPGRLKQRPTIHDLRHTHAAWLVAAGEPIAAISQRLGHRTTEVTELVYAGILPKTRSSMAAAVGAAMGVRSTAGAAAAP
jgi:integrase